jgi:hypothetical protein
MIDMTASQLRPICNAMICSRAGGNSTEDITMAKQAKSRVPAMLLYRGLI